jgi:hypothetical protein
MKLTKEEYWKKGSDKLGDFVNEVEAIVSTFPEPRQSQIKSMMSSPIGEQFMTSPASTRRAFHNAFPCGLVAHSLNVVNFAVKLSDTLAPGRWPVWKIKFCALFHDLGKAGSPGKPYYTSTSEKWKLDKEEGFQVSQEEYMPNAEKSLYILQLYGVTLDYEETLAIRLNDGMGPVANKDYSFKEPLLSLIIHWADHFASRLEKSEEL